jgi:hypothetical protein
MKSRGLDLQSGLVQVVFGLIFGSLQNHRLGVMGDYFLQYMVSCCIESLTLAYNGYLSCESRLGSMHYCFFFVFHQFPSLSQVGGLFRWRLQRRARDAEVATTTGLPRRVRRAETGLLKTNFAPQLCVILLAAE